jgi:hypothetical protein
LENGMIIEIPKTRNTIHDPCHLTLNWFLIRMF